MSSDVIPFSRAVASPSLAASAWVGLRLKIKCLLRLKRERETDWKLEAEIESNCKKDTFWKLILG